LMQWGRVSWSASRPSKNFHQSRPCVTLACSDTCWSTAVTYVHLRCMKHMKLWEHFDSTSLSWPTVVSVWVGCLNTF
jgi:hypothetical protein